MKVAFFLHSFPTISETFILNQITGLIDLGVDIEIFAFKNPHQEKHHSDIDKYKLMNKVTYIEPDSKIKKLFGLINLIPKYLFRNPYLFMQCFNIKKFGKNAINLRTLYASYHLQDKNFDIIHCHFGPMGAFMINIKELLDKNFKIITTFYGYDISKYPKENGKNCYKKLFDKEELFLCLSNNMRNDLIKLGCPLDKIKIHHLGINPSSYPYIERKKIKKIRILTIARLVEKKGLEYSINAVSKLKSINIEYNIIGDGALRDKLEKLINKLEMNDKIHLLGWMDREEVKKYIYKSDIFILTSITQKDGDKEGTPTVILEAASSGLPVISTYHAGIPEQVKDMKSGFLVKEKDTDEIVKKLQVHINNDSLRLKMGRAGRKIVMKEYDIHKLNKNLKHIYQKFR